MRIIVLGGAGLEGTGIAKDLVSSGVSEVVLADYNLEGAQNAAADLSTKDTKVTAQFVDANDHASLVDTIKGFDAVANAIGPFYIYGVKIVKAAIEARVPYVDIDDDHEPNRQVLELDNEAKKAGVPIVSSCGASPGCTNLLAAYGAAKLDRVDEINIKWAWPGSGGGAGVAALYHGFDIWSGMCPQFFEGQWQDVPAGSGREVVDFPQIGSCPISYCGHAEPVTLPRFIKGVKTVTCKGGVFPPLLDKYLFSLAALGLAAKEPINVGEQAVVPRDFSIMYLAEKMPEIEREVAELSLPEVGAIRVEVTGEKSGMAAKYLYNLVDLPDKLTATPASIVVQMAAKGQIAQAGALAPEVLNLDQIFAELKKRNFIFYETEEVTRKI